MGYIGVGQEEKYKKKEKKKEEMVHKIFNCS